MSSTQAHISASTTKASIIPALTGIRAIAAYMVFFHHFPMAILQIPGWDVQREFHIGVSIFFVLSGFLISYRYQDRFQLQGTWLKRYFLNRFARIYPVYFLLLIPTLLLREETPLLMWVANLTLFKGFFEGYHFSGIAQAWSLTVEECFYFSAPFIFFLHKRFNSLLRPYLGFVLLLPLIIFLGQQIQFFDFMGSPNFVIGYTFFGRFTEFFIGIFLAKMIQQPQRYAFMHKVQFPTWIGVLGILTCLLFMTQLDGPGMAHSLDHPIGLAVNNLVLPCFVALLFWGLIFRQSWLQRILSSKGFGLLGKSSYVFYLIHMGFIADQLHAWNIHAVWLIFLIMILVSIVLFKGFEEPMNKWIRSL